MNIILKAGCSKREQPAFFLRFICHFDEDDPSDSEQAKQITLEIPQQLSIIFIEFCV
jgi:hypothetical protein